MEVWVRLLYRSTSWGTFSSQLTPKKTAPWYSPCQQWLSMLRAVESAWLFLCGPSPLKQATGGIRFPGGWGARVVYRFENAAVNRDEPLALTHDPITSGSCGESLPEGYSEGRRCFTWPQTHRIPQHQYQGLHFSLSGSPTQTFGHHFPTCALMMSHHAGRTGKEQLWLFKVWMCHRDGG